LQISIASKDCTKANTQGQAGQAACSRDITFSLALFAHATNQIMFATEDCRHGQTFNTICGSSIALSVEAIAEAAYSASKAALFAVTPTPIDNRAPDLNEVRKGISELAVTMSQFGNTLSRAVRTCAKQALGIHETDSEEPRNFHGPWTNQKLGEPRSGRLPPYLNDWAMQVLALGQNAGTTFFLILLLLTIPFTGVAFLLFRFRTSNAIMAAGESDASRPCMITRSREVELLPYRWDMSDQSYMT